jgi:hypothetical protein
MVASESIADSTRLAQAHIRMRACPLAQCQLGFGFPEAWTEAVRRSPTVGRRRRGWRLGRDLRAVRITV